jgi:peptidoglycan-associated lipoprotein
MKSQNTFLALLVGATLLAAGAGCKKSPKPPTLIPSKQPTVVDNPQPIKPTELPPGKTGTGPGTGAGTGGTLGNDPTAGRNLNDPGTGANPTGNPIDPKDASQVISRFDPNLPEHPEILKAETVYYDLDRSTVKASERPKLDRVATYMKNNTTALLRVEGNCDERGTEDYNRSLGERRALSAREYLVNAGVAPDRITTVTYGEDKPAETGHDEAAWGKNRRADFVVLGGTPPPIQ